MGNKARKLNEVKAALIVSFWVDSKNTIRSFSTLTSSGNTSSFLSNTPRIRVSSAKEMAGNDIFASLSLVPVSSFREVIPSS